MSHLDGNTDQGYDGPVDHLPDEVGSAHADAPDTNSRLEQQDDPASTKAAQNVPPKPAQSASVSEEIFGDMVASAQLQVLQGLMEGWPGLFTEEEWALGVNWVRGQERGGEGHPAPQEAPSTMSVTGRDIEGLATGGTDSARDTAECFHCKSKGGMIQKFSTTSGIKSHFGLADHRHLRFYLCAYKDCVGLFESIPEREVHHGLAHPGEEKWFTLFCDNVRCPFHVNGFAKRGSYSSRKNCDHRGGYLWL